MSGDDFGRLLYLGLLLAAVAGWGLAEYRGRLGQGARSFLAWGLIFVGVMAGYGLWQDIRRDVLPRQSVTQSGQIELPRANDGHFYATLDINGTGVLFMADTGATNMVLSGKDAARLGIDPSALVFLGEAATANGVVRTARVTLPEVALGPFRDTDIAAYVTDGAMDISLLGMDYLRQFRIEIADDRMILSR